MSGLQKRMKEAELEQVLRDLAEILDEQDHDLGDNWSLYQCQDTVWLATEDNEAVAVGRYEQIEALQLLKKSRDLLPVFHKIVTCLQQLDDIPEKLEELIKLCYDELEEPLQPETDDAVAAESIVQHVKDSNESDSG